MYQSCYYYQELLLLLLLCHEIGAACCSMQVMSHLVNYVALSAGSTVVPVTDGHLRCRAKVSIHCRCLSN